MIAGPRVRLAIGIRPPPGKEVRAMKLARGDVGRVAKAQNI